MSSDLMSAMGAAATGLRAQTVRIRISAENLANADSTATTDRATSHAPETIGKSCGHRRFVGSSHASVAEASAA